MLQIASRGHSRPLTEISFVQDGPDRTLLVSSAHDKTPQVRNGDTGDWIGTFLGHKGAVWSCKIDAFSRTLAATASGDFTARLWCATTGKELVELKHKHVVKSVDFSADSSQIATGCQDGLMRIYDTAKAATNTPQEYKIVHNVQDGITKVSWSVLDHNIVIVGKKASMVEKWDSRVDPVQGAVQSATLSSNATVMDFEENKTHNMLLTASGTKVHALTADTLQVIKEYDMPSPMTFVNEGGVTLSSDGSKFYAGASDLWLREVDMSSGEVLRTFKGHHGPIRCVRFHPSRNLVASGSEDATIRLWDLTNNNPAL